MKVKAIMPRTVQLLIVQLAQESAGEVHSIHTPCHSTHVPTPSCREASPGKLGAFEDELFRNSDMADVPVVMAVALSYVEGHRTVGIAFADTARRQLGACEFTDDEHFCNLELAVVQLGARECMLAKVGPLPDRIAGTRVTGKPAWRRFWSTCNALGDLEVLPKYQQNASLSTTESQSARGIACGGPQTKT